MELFDYKNLYKNTKLKTIVQSLISMLFITVY